MKDKNKLIADFMGLIPIDNQDELSWYYVEDEVYFNNDFRYNNQIEYTTSDMLPYKESWDWLMPVVDKIEDTCSTNLHKYSANQMIKEKYTFEILSYSNNFGNTTYGKNKLQVIYKGVVEFIKWYNKIKK